MQKKIIEAMKQLTVSTVQKKGTKLISVTAGQSKDAESGELIPHVKVEAEIPKGCGVFSACRFGTKIPNGKVKVSDEELDQSDFYVLFKNLEISYIDDRGNVYFRAEDYSVRKEGN